MITESKAYARLSRETSLDHEERMQWVEALFGDSTPKGYTHRDTDSLGLSGGVPLQSIIDSPFALIKGLAECAHDDEDMSHLFDNQPVLSRFVKGRWK